jgi:hypothetical protein
MLELIYIGSGIYFELLEFFLYNSVWSRPTASIREELKHLDSTVNTLPGIIRPGLITIPEGGFNLKLVIEEVQKDLIKQALIRTKFVKTHAADLLGISFRSFCYYVQKLQIDSAKLEEDHHGRRTIRRKRHRKHGRDEQDEAS